MRMFTFLSLDEIVEYERLSGAEPNRAKEVLAFEATKITHGEEAAREAQEAAHARFGGSGADPGPALAVTQPTALVELAVKTGLAEHNNDPEPHNRHGRHCPAGDGQPTTRPCTHP